MPLSVPAALCLARLSALCVIPARRSFPAFARARFAARRASALSKPPRSASREEAALASLFFFPRPRHSLPSSSVNVHSNGPCEPRASKV